MAVQGSPDIFVKETDFSSFVSNDTVTTGAIVGEYQWGPVNSVTTITSEGDFIRNFGYPCTENYIDWYCARNYLYYSGSLKVVRAFEYNYNEETQTVDGSYQACDTIGLTTEEEADVTKSKMHNVVVENYEQFVQRSDILGTGLTPIVLARYPGKNGNNIHVSIIDAYGLSQTSTTGRTSPIIRLINKSKMSDTDIAVAVWYGRDPNVDTPDEFGYYSKLETSTDISGYPNYIFNTINKNSNYIYLVAKNMNGATYKDVEKTNPNGTKTQVREFQYYKMYDPESGEMLPYNEQWIDIDVTLKFGAETMADPRISENWTAAKTSAYTRGWDLFSNEDTDDNVSLLIQGAGNIDVGKYMVENIASKRKDCVACLSPAYEECVVNTSADRIVNYIINGSASEYGVGNSGNLSWSYAFMDGNYKYQWDAYGNTYRWVPLNGDIAGLFAQIDFEEDPWISIGNHSIKNCTKLAFYPSKAQRDLLYEYNVNPVTNFNGSTLVWGDWTRVTNTSFNFVGVRRMFLYIERAIKQYARTIMFKQNDYISETMFKQLVEPFLEGVKGGRGISEFKVYCGSEVTSKDEMDRGIFNAQILIKPVRSIRYIVLNFAAVNSNISIDEIIE